MSFFTQSESNKTGNNYLKIISGQNVTILILDDTPYEVGKHWMRDSSGQSYSITCPGQDVCPVCLHNKELNYNRDDPTYLSRSRRYMVNVLDLTPVIKCPACDAVYEPRTVPQSCSCGENLVGIKASPVNEVKILERGKKLMQLIASLEQVPHPFTGEVMKVQEFPIMLVASGKGTEMEIMPMPQAPVDIDTSNLVKYDFSTFKPMSPQEVQAVLDGVTYKDIFAARRAEFTSKVAANTDEDDGFNF